MYFPANLTGNGTLAIFHLPGLLLDVNGCYIGGIHVTKLTYFEWRMLERNAVAEIYDSEYCKRHHYYAVLPFSPAQVENAEEKDKADSLLATAEESVKQLVLALRLFRDGDLCDPEFATVYFRRGSLLTRRVGIYRELLLEYPHDVFSPLVTTIKERTSVEAYLHIIINYQSHWREDAIELAIDNFNWSFMPLISEQRRLSFLVICLEVLTAGVNTKYAGRDGLKRIRAALNEADGDREELQQFVTSRLQDVRNLVAHGAAAELTDTEVKYFREICRIMIRQSMITAIKRKTLAVHVWPHLNFIGKTATDSTHKDRPLVHTSILELYNSLLAKCFKGELTAEECFNNYDLFSDEYSKALFGDDRSQPPIN